MTDITTVTDKDFEAFMAAAENTDLEMSADDISEAIIKRILASTSVDEVLGGAATTPAKDVLGKPFTLTGCHFNRSGIEGDGPGFYAVLDMVTTDGEKLAVTCGAGNVLAQAWKLVQLGALPIAVTINQSPKPTANGYHVMWLEAAPKSF